MAELFALSRAPTATSQDLGEAASVDDMAELMAMAGMFTPAEPTPKCNTPPQTPPALSRLPSLLWKVPENEEIPAAPLRIRKEECQAHIRLTHKERLATQEIVERRGVIESLPNSWPQPDPDADADAEADEIVKALKRSASGLKHRPVKGQVALKGVATQAETISAVLTLSAGGNLSLVGGAELDEEFLSMPFSHVLLEPVPDHDNCIHLKAKKKNDDTAGIIIVLPTSSIRDLWLTVSKGMKIKIDKWRYSPDMSRDWTPERPLSANGALPLARWLS